MAKCRMLLQENEELGKTVSSGRLAKLEGDIALQKKLIFEMKSSEKGRQLFIGWIKEIVYFFIRRWKNIFFNIICSIF